MGRKGGLGQLAAEEESKDLLDVVFGGGTEEKADTPPRPSRAKPQEDKSKGTTGKLASLYLQLDADLVRKVKVFAAENDMKVKAVISSALQQFLAGKGK